MRQGVSVWGGGTVGDRLVVGLYCKEVIWQIKSHRKKKPVNVVSVANTRVVVHICSHPSTAVHFEKKNYLVVFLRLDAYRSEWQCMRVHIKPAIHM